MSEIQVIEITDPDVQVASIVVDDTPAGAQTAADIAVTPTGNISSTNAQAALAELDSEKVAWGDFSYTNLDDIPAQIVSLTAVLCPADTLPYFSSPNTFSLTDFPAAGRSLVSAVNAAAQRSVLGLAGTNVLLASVLAASATARIFGRKTAGAGAGEELTLSEALDLIGSAAQGDILYRGASGWSRLAAGTSGYFLKTLGPGANPAWDVGGSGAAVDGSNITTPATWLSKLNALDQYDTLARINELKGGVVFDGVTTGQRSTAFLGDMNIGKGDFTASIVLRIPSSIPASGAFILALSPSATTTTNNTLLVWIDTAGKLNVTLYGTSSASSNTYRWISTSAVTTTHGGKFLVLSVTRSSGTGTVHINGVDFTSSGSWTSGGGGGAPASFAESISSSYAHIGGLASVTPYTERIVSVALFNRALSSTEVLTLVNSGILADARWVAIHGYNSVLNSERNAIFSAGATDWVATGGGTSISSAGAVVLGAAAGSVSLSGISGYLAQLTPGVLYKLSFDISSGTFGANSVTAYFGTAVAGTEVNIGTFNANGSYAWEFTPTMGVGVLSLVAVTGGSNWTLSNVRITRVLAANGSFETAGSPLGSWTNSVAGSSTVVRNTSLKRSGAACCELSVVAGAFCSINQTCLTCGKRYQISYYAKASSAGVQIALCDNASGTNYSAPTLSTSWVQYTAEFVAVGTQVQIKRATGSGDYSIYIDDIEFCEAGAVAEWGPAGLNEFTPLWANSNPIGADGYITGLSQRADGSFVGIVPAAGGMAERDVLANIGRTSGVMSLGGVVLPGNTSQRLTIPSGPDLDVNSFWIRFEFLCPTTNPGASAGGLFCCSSSSSAASAAYQVRGYIDGSLVLQVFGATTSDYRTITLANFVQMFGGRVVDCIMCRSGGALNVWVNGRRMMFVETVTGTVPTFGVDLVSTYIHIGCRDSAKLWQGEFYQFQIGRGAITDAMARQVYAAGIGTGSGAAAATPISRGGIMASTDGVVLDVNLAIGWGQFYPDKTGNGYHATSNLGDEGHKLPNRVLALNYSSADKRFAGAVSNGAGSLHTYGDAFSVAATNTNSPADSTQPNGVNCASVATTGNWCGFYSNASHYVGRNPRFAALVKFPEITNVSIWVGFHAGATTLLLTDTPAATSVAAFRYSPARAGDSAWKCVTHDGTSQTTNDSGVAPTTNLVLLEIEIIAGQRVNFYIDGKLVKSNVTNLPASSALMRWQTLDETRENVSHNARLFQVDITS